MSDIHFIKSPAGHTEIQTKALPLSRPVRNLLLLINDSQPASYWLSQIRGVTEADLKALQAQGLVMPSPTVRASSAPAPAPAQGPAPVPASPSPKTPAPAANAAAAAPAAALPDEAWARIQQTVRNASYSTLYNALTSQGKAQLGLMRGYKFVLEVEKCSGPAELQAFSLRFIEQLRDDHGMSAVRKFCDALATDLRSP